MSYHDELQLLVIQKMIIDSEYAALVLEVLLSMRTDTCKTIQLLVDACVQPSSGWRGGHGTYDIYDAAALIYVEKEMHAGNLVVGMVPVGTSPGPDRNSNLNTTNLKLCLPKYFQTEVNHDNQLNDGYFSWSEDLLVQNINGEDVCIKPDSVPMEVGTTKGTTTWFHLMHESGLARWPYDSTNIILLARTGTTSNFLEAALLQASEKVAPTIASIEAERFAAHKEAAAKKLEHKIFQKAERLAERTKKTALLKASREADRSEIQGPLDMRHFIQNGPRNKDTEGIEAARKLDHVNDAVERWFKNGKLQ